MSTNAHFAAQFTPFMLGGLGAAFHSTAVANAGNHLTSNLAIAWLSVAVMLIVAALSLFSVKVVARIIFWLIVLQVLAFVVLIGMLAFNSHADFVSALGTYSNHPGAYQAIISAARSNGVVFGTSIASAVAIIPFMVLNYNGVLYSHYVGGELRRPGRTYLYASAISIGVLVVLWIGVWALLRARAGLTFMQAQANLGVINPTAYGKITSLNSVAGGLGYGMVLSSDPITKILFATAVPLAEIAVNLAFLTVTTRVLFAQAFDRLLPVGVAKIGERNHAPNVDRFTGYDAPAIARMGFDGGKMLLRIDPGDPATAGTLQACAHAVSDLADRQLIAMIEPFISHRVDGRVRNDLSPEAMMRAIAVASGLGTTSAYTWLKVPVVLDMERVMAASTLPALLLGGEVPDDPESTYAGWRKALRLPNVKGLVAGRSLLYPADGDVAAAVDTAVGLL